MTMSDRWLLWQRQTARWLRDTGLFPSAEHCGRFAREKEHGDVLHIGDRIAEDTLEAWPNIAAKLKQAEHAAEVQGFDQWFVWKPLSARVAPPWPKDRVAGSVVIWRADVIWPVLARLDRLEGEVAEWRDRTGAAEERAESAYHRGYEDGRRPVSQVEGGNWAARSEV